MAGEEYIRVALANLERAMVAKQNEANNIRRQITELDSQRHNKKQELESQINQNNGVIANGDSSDESRAIANRHNMQLEAEKSRIDHDTDRRRAEFDQQLRQNEEDWRGLQRIISNLGGI